MIFSKFVDWFKIYGIYANHNNRIVTVMNQNIRAKDCYSNVRHVIIHGCVLYEI